MNEYDTRDRLVEGQIQGSEKKNTSKNRGKGWA